jgi:hypothetical protein
LYLKTYEPQSDHTGLYYLSFFAALNDILNPAFYLEIGTGSGTSASNFTCKTICIDPELTVATNVVGTKREMYFFQMTSDDFFATQQRPKFGVRGPDITFLDGMHRFEYLVRDFLNIESWCHPGSLILIHDCLPQNARMTNRTGASGTEDEGVHQFSWTGDVWKIVPILKKYRPDLRIHFIDCPPTGLVAVTRLDPNSRVLAEAYHDIIIEFRDLEYTDYGKDRLWTDFPMLDSAKLVQNRQDFTLFLDVR